MPKAITLSDETFELFKRYCEARERLPDDVVRELIGEPLDREAGWLERILVSAFEDDEEYSEEEIEAALEGRRTVERGEVYTAEEVAEMLNLDLEELKPKVSRAV